MKLVTGIKELDHVLGGVRERSLIMIHEADPRSLGRFLALEITRAKLDSENLVGFFNIGTPLPIMLEIMNKTGIDWERHLKEQRLMIVDTFGSIYDTEVKAENIWYLKKPITIDTLNNKYLEVIQKHKEKWAERDMFRGREIWGITIAISDYIRIFGMQHTQRYIEIADLQRVKAEVYKKYPAGTNIWVYSGNDTVVMPLIYRKADYVLRTESRVEDGEVKRVLKVIKIPDLKEVPPVEYTFKNWKVTFK
jgi:KaiC/GvpD/RAD55 family RecA-like ATPase